jgi:hypothetical protein
MYASNLGPVVLALCACLILQYRRLFGRCPLANGEQIISWINLIVTTVISGSVALLFATGVPVALAIFAFCRGVNILTGRIRRWAERRGRTQLLDLIEHISQTGASPEQTKVAAD